MAPVEIIFRTILCAVPAFMRDDPASTSAPTSVTMAKSAARSSGELRLQVSAMVWAPRRRAYSTAAMVNGVRPLLAMPRTMSRLPGLRFFISAMASAVSSSLASVEAARALGASGHDELHGARISIESRRNFGGVEGADAAAGSGSDVDEASALAESGDDHVDGAGDLRQSAAHRGGDGRVFVVHQAHDFERRHAIEIDGAGKNLFGGKLAKVGVVFVGVVLVLVFLADWRQVVGLSEVKSISFYYYGVITSP